MNFGYAPSFVRLSDSGPFFRASAAYRLDFTNVESKDNNEKSISINYLFTGVLVFAVNVVLVLRFDCDDRPCYNGHIVGNRIVANIGVSVGRSSFWQSYEFVSTDKICQGKR